MQISRSNLKRRQEGNILAYFILLVIILSAIGSVSVYVTQTTSIAHRRSDMIAARLFAQGGAVAAAADLSTAYLSQSNSFPGGLTKLGTPYVYSTSLSSGTQSVYLRTISAPFSNQSVTAQIWVPSGSSPTTAKVITTATVGKVTQTATLNLQMIFGYGAAILSVNPGTQSNGMGKPIAEDGNVVVNGGSSGGNGGSSYLIVDGGTGLAIDANGSVNVDNTATVPPSAISEGNYGTANQIPDYTGQGNANSLFDFGRFIAVADLTPTTYNTNTHNNHFTNVLSFVNAMKNATNHILEGVVAVDINSTDKNWSSAGDKSMFPYGINVHGTLFYNFGPEFGPTTKFTMTADLNINPANLSFLNATNTTTYATGYPPVYNNNSLNPTNINITSKGYTNFVAGDDLPGLMYSIGEVDIHGNANVSGVCYTPSYMEIENKENNGIQYFKGMMIMGQGIYYENTQAGNTSIISYDRSTLDNLTTAGSKGKIVTVSYWQ